MAVGLLIVILIQFIFDPTTSKVIADGVSLDIGDVFLLKDGGDNEVAANKAIWNGFWIITSFPSNAYAFCERVSDTNYKSIRGGNFAFIEDGTVNAAKGFVCTNPGIPSLGADGITFNEIKTADPSQITEGNTSVTTTDSGTNGTITFNTDGTNRWAFESSGHLIPASNANYDIGEAENKVRHLYLSDNSIKFDSGDLSVIADNLTWTTSGTASKIITQQNNLLTVDGSTNGGAINPYMNKIVMV